MLDAICMSKRLADANLENLTNFVLHYLAFHKTVKKLIFKSL